MANSVGYHESEDKLTPETLDNHRALTSMQEELEAVDWYDQRVSAATDPALKEILAHNRDEEKEHFVMLLEWFRRRDAKMSTELEGRLFTTGSIVAQEQATITTVGGRELAFHNTNQLLGRLDGVLGLKTGYTQQAGHCLIAVAEQSGHRVWLVLLDSHRRWWTAHKIITDAFAAAAHGDHEHETVYAGT